METFGTSPFPPGDPAPRIDPAIVLANPSASIRELTAAARECQRQVAGFDGEIDALADERREASLRQMKSALRSEIDELRDARSELLSTMDALLERVASMSFAKSLRRAQKEGQDPKWVASHKDGLLTKLRAIKPKVSKGLNSKLDTVRDRWKKLGDELTKIHALAPTDQARIQDAEKFLEAFDPILHARIVGESKKGFLDAFLDSLSPTTTK
jgi:chromosome segregation ATPase